MEPSSRSAPTPFSQTQPSECCMGGAGPMQQSRGTSGQRGMSRPRFQRGLGGGQQGGGQCNECLNILEDMTYDHMRDVFHVDLIKSLLVQRNYLPIRELIEAYLLGQQPQIQQDELLQLLVEHNIANVAIDAVIKSILKDQLINRELCDVAEDFMQNMPHENNPEEVCQTRCENSHLDSKMQAVVRQFYNLGDDLGKVLLDHYNPQGVEDLDALHEEIRNDVRSYFGEPRGMTRRKPGGMTMQGGRRGVRRTQSGGMFQQAGVSGSGGSRLGRMQSSL